MFCFVKNLPQGKIMKMFKNSTQANFSEHKLGLETVLGLQDNDTTMLARKIVIKPRNQMSNFSF